MLDARNRIQAADERNLYKKRAKELVAQMTLEEKVGQMLFTAPSIPRLGIPAYNWWNEALHGVARAGVATSFPQAIGMAASFDPTLLKKAAEVISTEGRAKHHEYFRNNDFGVYKGLTFWSPNVNIFRDPRWGRGHETYGEDPYLTSRLGVAFVDGLQGDHPDYMKSAACAKHFAVHSGPEGVRHSFDAIASQKDMRETYLPAFKALVQEAGVEAVMGAYNRTNGEPCCGSKTLLQDILRDEWQFDGHVTSDCWAIQDFHLHHKVTMTAPESSAMAVNNGCDLNCGNMYANLLIAIEEGLVDEATIDKSVTRLMTTRLRLGMFDDASKVPFTAIPIEQNDCAAHHAVAKEVAARSMVLLRNNGILPLNDMTGKTIAVIGPNADSRKALIGNYYGTASRYVTVLEGINARIGLDADVLYSEGCHLHKEHMDGVAAFCKEKADRIAEAVSVAKRADVCVVVLGLDETLEGEEGDQGNQYASGDKLSLDLPGKQLELLQAVKAVGKPTIVICMAGSALDLSWADANTDAVIQAWYPGAEGGEVVANLLFGDINPSGRLPVTFYRTLEEIPAFEDYSMEGRTYRFMKNEALYPFGYGLSYTSFAYGNVAVDAPVVQSGNTVVVSTTVRNTGKYAGIETVQLYLKDLEASWRTPNCQLAGVQAVYLAPGEEKAISFTIMPEQMMVVNDAGEFILEPGAFEAYVGGTQPDTRSEALTGMKVGNVRFMVQ